MIADIVSNMKIFFNTHQTKDINFRIDALKKLRNSIKQHEKDIFEALKTDFNKPEMETYSTELLMVYMELDLALSRLRRWARPKRTGAGLVSFPSYGKIIAEPYGVTLVMAPWNYPFHLAVLPLIGAISAGNCCVVKPSNYSAATSDIIKIICQECFAPEYVTVVLGGREQNQQLLDQKFDFIFFTGGVTVGKLVLEKAAKFATPAVLELGGKSPVIVDASCNLPLTVRRLVWGKFVNAGQTCVAPDYVLVDETIHDKFIQAVKQQIKQNYYYAQDGKLTDNFPNLISDKQFAKVSSMIDEQKTIIGGKRDEQKHLIEPTVMDGVTLTDKVMSEEIFGPLMPVITYSNLEQAISIIGQVNGGAKPLALYMFSNDKLSIKKVLSQVSFGGGCINDTLMHVSTHHLPFGGVENSGMGSYHGEKTFATFSHYKSILVKGNVDIPLRYPPYEKKLTAIRKLMKK